MKYVVSSKNLQFLSQNASLILSWVKFNSVFEKNFKTLLDVVKLLEKFQLTAQKKLGVIKEAIIGKTPIELDNIFIEPLYYCITQK